MATTRIKDISSTVTSLASDDYIAVDGATNGTRKMVRSSIYTDVAAAFTGAPTTYDICPLNSGTNKIDATYLPTSGDTPKGEWNANTNSPALADGAGTAGDYYDVTTGGTQNLGSGSIAYTVGDVVKYNGSTWFKIDSVANILDGSATAADGRSALSVNSKDEDAQANGTKTTAPALYFNGSSSVVTVADDNKLTFSSLTEFGKTTAGAWSPEDNTPALTDGTGTLNDHYKIDADGTVAQGGSTLSIIDGTSVTAGQVVYYDGSVWRVKDCDDLPVSFSAWIKSDDLSVEFPILTKYGLGVEWSFYVQGSDLALNFYDGSVSSGGRTTSVVTGYNGQWIHVAATYAGAGPNSGNGFPSAGDGVTLYINGEAQAATAINNASYVGVSNTTQTVKIGSRGVFAKGHIRDVKIFNRELTATEVAELAKGNDLGFADEWGGALGGVYTSDFSAGVDGYAAINGAVAGNIDAVGPGGDLRDDNLRFTCNATSGEHYAYKSVTLTSGKRYRVEFDVYISGANSNIDGISLRNGLGSPAVLTPSTDTWTRFSEELTSTYTGSISLRWQMYDGAVATFQDAGGDDLVYIRNIKITEIGTLADFRAENFIADKLIDLSSNNFVGTNNGATLVGGRKALQLDTDGAAAGNKVLSVFNGSSHLASITDKGDLDANSIGSGAATELTISSGAVTVTKSHHTIDTESDAASDDLDTINGGRAGQLLILRAANGARDVVLKDGTGNLKLSGDITLDNTEDTATLVSDGTSWYLLATSNNGA